jgi:hypothetical protein
MPVTGRFAQISVAHELISVFVKSHQRTTDPTSCVARADNFLPRRFYFFWNNLSNSGERVEARAYADFASDLLLRNDPVTHLRPLSPKAALQGSAATQSTRS